MKTCKGCGAFFHEKCEYCGYKDFSWKEEDKVNYTTLIIKGDRNQITIKYGESPRDTIHIKGDRQQIIITAKIINIVIYGNRNQIIYKNKVIYASIIEGNRNQITTYY